MKKNKGITTFMGKPVTLLGDMVQPGEIAPNFTALAADSKPVNLSDFKGKVIIISSVPSVDTGVCAAQTRRFNTEAASLGEVVILNFISYFHTFRNNGIWANVTIITY